MRLGKEPQLVDHKGRQELCLVNKNTVEPHKERAIEDRVGIEQKVRFCIQTSAAHDSLRGKA